MRRLFLFLFLLVILLGAAGAVFVATWDIPPPTKETRKVVPDERFPR